MTSLDTASDRLPTGIAGLDQVLEGGLLRNGVYIAEGPPGAGKTLLATQLCFAAARRGERALYTTLLAESHERMLTHLSRMKFFDETLVPDAVYFISAFRALQQDGLPALLRLLREAILERKASILILDGMVTAEEISLARSPTSNELLQDRVRDERLHDVAAQQQRATAPISPSVHDGGWHLGADQRARGAEYDSPPSGAQDARY
jgi:predicted ATP-dependent serine protease